MLKYLQIKIDDLPWYVNSLVVYSQSARILSTIICYASLS